MELVLALTKHLSQREAKLQKCLVLGFRQHRVLLCTLLEHSHWRNFILFSCEDNSKWLEIECNRSKISFLVLPI